MNHQAWPAKYGVFFVTVLATLVVPNTPLFTGVYLVGLRICAALFILIQQVILIDVAYN